MTAQPERLSSEQRADIRRREQAATAGPWTVSDLHVEAGDVRIADFETLADSDEEWAQMEADAQFAAAARTDVPDLLAEVERLTAIVYPTPEQLTKIERQARYILEETQPPIYTEALAKHVLTLGAALREAHVQAAAAVDGRHRAEAERDAKLRRNAIGRAYVEMRDFAQRESERLAEAVAERDRLAERLTAAERVCLMFGWSPSSAHAGDREKATFVLWQCWYELVGEEFLAPERHPDLSDEAIAELARQRDATRARVRDKLRGLVETEPAGEADNHG